MGLILKTKSNFRAARNVTVAPIEREKQCSIRFKVSITYFVFERSVKLKGFPFHVITI